MQHNDSLLTKQSKSFNKNFFKLALIVFCAGFFVFNSGLPAQASSASDYWKTYFSTEELKAVQKNAEKYTLAQIKNKSEQWHNILTGFNIKNGSITDDNIKKNEIATNKIKGLGDFIDEKISGSSTPQDFSANNLTGTYAALDGSHITNLTASQVGAVPYTGATSNLDLGSRTLTTTSTGTFGNIKTPIISPSTDSTSAFQINKADGTTNVLNVDTTNGRVGIGTGSPNAKLDVNGDILISGTGTQGSTMPYFAWIGGNSTTSYDISVDGALSGDHVYGLTVVPGIRVTGNMNNIAQLYTHAIIGGDGSPHTVSSVSNILLNDITLGPNITATTAYGINVPAITTGQTNIGVYSFSPFVTSTSYSFGGLTSFYPKFSNSGTEIEAYLGDGSDWTGLYAKYLNSRTDILLNASGSGGSLYFGGKTSSYARLVGSGVEIQAQRADGVAYATLTALNYKSMGGVYQWVNSGSVDTGLSRGAAGKIYVGNGTSQDYSGTLIATNVGIGTATPAATLDVNGQVKIQKSSSQPFACDATHDGTIALTSGYRTCACKGGSTAWVFTTDGTTTCTW